jgi:hypothetical protein
MRKNDDSVVRLPNEVVELLNTKGIPKTAVAIRRAEGADMPLTTYGLKAATERLNAESDLYDATLRLESKRGEMVSVEEQRELINKLTDENRQLRQSVDELRAELTRQTASSAMAISSGSDK